MIDNSIRQMIGELNPETPLFDDYDGSIVGLTDDFRVVYDFKKMVAEGMEVNGWTEEESVEWLEYNTLRTIPYMGEYAPVVIRFSAEDMRG